MGKIKDLMSYDIDDDLLCPKCLVDTPPTSINRWGMCSNCAQKEGEK
jgi:hypothetical protein